MVLETLREKHILAPDQPPLLVSPTGYDQWLWPQALEAGAKGFIINWKDAVYTEKCAVDMRQCRSISIDDLTQCPVFTKLLGAMVAKPALADYLKRASTDFAPKFLASWQRCASNKAQPVCAATVKTPYNALPANHPLKAVLTAQAAAWKKVKSSCGW